MPTYAIGDVQGCFDELCQLLQVISFSPTRDQLWFAGDLVNRGPNSLAVLRFVKNLGSSARMVLGNHDLHLLALAHGAYPEASPALRPILEAPDRQDLIDWLKMQPLIDDDKNENYALVHAGLPPQWTLDEAVAEAKAVSAVLQSKACAPFLKKLYGDTPALWKPNLRGTARLRYTVNALTRLRFCDSAGKLKLKANNHLDWENPPQKLIPWFKHPERKTKSRRIIFGHWAALGGMTFEPNVYALDTGCVWGGFLTAMRLSDQVRFSVPARSVRSLESQSDIS